MHIGNHKLRSQPFHGVVGSLYSGTDMMNGLRTLITVIGGNPDEGKEGACQYLTGSHDVMWSRVARAIYVGRYVAGRSSGSESSCGHDLY